MHAALNALEYIELIRWIIWDIATHGIFNSLKCVRKVMNVITWYYNRYNALQCIFLFNGLKFINLLTHYNSLNF
jgi:hypothetical protein